MIDNWKELRTYLHWAYEGPARAKTKSLGQRSTDIPGWLIRKGDLSLSYQNGTETYTTGQWVFPRYDEGEHRFSDDAEIISIRFEMLWADGSPLFDRTHTWSFWENEEPALTQCAHELVALNVGGEGWYGAPGRTARSLEVFLKEEQTFYAWMRAYAETMHRKGVPLFLHQKLDERVWAAITYMDMRNLRRPLLENEVALRVGLSVTQLNRLFLTELGKTVAEYWDERRVRAARSALEGSARAIKEIAFSLGFSSLPHFSSWAKMRLGCSPREYRNQMK